MGNVTCMLLSKDYTAQPIPTEFKISIIPFAYVLWYAERRPFQLDAN